MIPYRTAAGLTAFNLTTEPGDLVACSSTQDNDAILGSINAVYSVSAVNDNKGLNL